MRSRATAGAWVVMFLVAACTQEKAADTPGATLGTAAPTTTTTDPYAAPNPIDVAYVNRVLAGLDAVLGDVVRLVVVSRTIPREAADRLTALYGTDASLNLRLDSLSRDVAFRLNDFKQQPGNPTTIVWDLISAGPSCVFARVTRDYSAVAASPSAEPAVQWIAVVPLDASRDPGRYNRTGWSFVYDGFEPGRVPPQVDPCAGR